MSLGKKTCGMVCQFSLKTNCPEMRKYSWGTVSLAFHCMNTSSDLSILLLMDIWVMSYYGIVGVFYCILDISSLSGIFVANILFQFMKPFNF